MWDERLHQVARAKVRDMATRGYVQHSDPDGYGLNYVSRVAGFDVPAWYTDGIGGYNVEPLAAGQSTATAAMNAWLNSALHKEHVFANPG